jgi:hypothetical protein
MTMSGGKGGSLMAAGIAVMLVALLAGVRGNGPAFWIVTIIGFGLIGAGALAILAGQKRR